MPFYNPEYLLKSDLPPALLVCLNDLTIRTQSPAWTFVTDVGDVRYWGGALAHYGISNLRGDRPALEQLPFLTGLLPLGNEPLVLPRLELHPNIYADIHLFPAEGGAWVLMLDSTREAMEFRRIQQRGYDVSLFWLRPSGTTLDDLKILFAILELVVLERTPEGRFRLIGGIPEWFEKLYPNSLEVLSGDNFINSFPFIVNFLEDAHDLWNRRMPARLRSGPWVEADSDGQDWHLEATAICLGQTSLLLLESFKLVYEEIQPILQKARDNTLDFERLNKTREALRRSEARQRALLDAIPDLIFRLSRKGEILDYKSGHQFAGTNEHQDLRGQHVTALLPESVAEQVVTSLQGAEFPTGNARADVRLFEYQLPAGASHSFLEARVVLSGEDEALAIIRDITENKRAQEAEMVRRSEQYFRALIEDSSDVIVVANTDGTVRYESPSMERLMGHKPEQRVGRNGFELIHPEDVPATQQMFREVLTHPDKVLSMVARLANAKGEWRYVEAVVRNQMNKPEINGIVISFRDITERRRAEAERSRLQESLRRSETMAAMGSLVAAVAHEVRNPLFSLSATVDAFEARVQQQPEYTQYTSVLRGEITRLTRLMNDLLEYGKPFHLEMKSCRLRDIVEEAVKNCHKAMSNHPVRIENLVPEKLPSIMADHERLRQIFQNLIENAIQHSPETGVVSVSAQRAPASSQPFIEISVSDSGAGFQNEDLQHIFEPFFSRRHGGTGLGLSIVQRFIEAHNGSVSAGNRPEGGAVVTVQLPMNEEFQSPQTANQIGLQ